MALLVVFAGLPGSGKSVLARGVADAIGATYLRIDTIESAIVSALMTYRDNPVGYVVAGQVAADQLVAGRDVVADAVNGVAAARAGWVTLAAGTGAALRFVEVRCPRSYAAWKWPCTRKDRHHDLKLTGPGRSARGHRVSRTTPGYDRPSNPRPVTGARNARANGARPDQWSARDLGGPGNQRLPAGVLGPDLPDLYLNVRKLPGYVWASSR
jgi:predicted kinase